MIKLKPIISGAIVFSLVMNMCWLPVSAQEYVVEKNRVIPYSAPIESNLENPLGDASSDIPNISTYKKQTKNPSASDGFEISLYDVGQFFLVIGTAIKNGAVFCFEGVRWVWGFNFIRPLLFIVASVSTLSFPTFGEKGVMYFEADAYGLIRWAQMFLTLGISELIEPSAFALGNIIINYKSGDQGQGISANDFAHELVHIEQSKWLGPMFSSMYLLLCLYGVLTEEGFYRGNPFEVQAREAEARYRDIWIEKQYMQYVDENLLQKDSEQMWAIFRNLNNSIAKLSEDVLSDDKAVSTAAYIKLMMVADTFLSRHLHLEEAPVVGKILGVLLKGCFKSSGEKRIRLRNYCENYINTMFRGDRLWKFSYFMEFISLQEAIFSSEKDKEWIRIQAKKYLVSKNNVERSMGFIALCTIGNKVDIEILKEEYEDDESKLHRNNLQAMCCRLIENPLLRKYVAIQEYSVAMDDLYEITEKGIHKYIYECAIYDVSSSDTFLSSSLFLAQSYLQEGVNKFVEEGVLDSIVDFDDLSYSSSSAFLRMLFALAGLDKSVSEEKRKKYWVQAEIALTSLSPDVAEGFIFAAIQKKEYPHSYAEKIKSKLVAKRGNKSYCSGLLFFLAQDKSSYAVKQWEEIISTAKDKYEVSELLFLLYAMGQKKNPYLKPIIKAVLSKCADSEGWNIDIAYQKTLFLRTVINNPDPEYWQLIIDWCKKRSFWKGSSTFFIKALLACDAERTKSVRFEDESLNKLIENYLFYYDRVKK